MKFVSELLLFTVSVICSCFNAGSTENYRSAVKSYRAISQIFAASLLHRLNISV
jgi:hypothetical protein